MKNGYKLVKIVTHNKDEEKRFLEVTDKFIRKGRPWLNYWFALLEEKSKKKIFSKFLGIDIITRPDDKSMFSSFDNDPDDKRNAEEVDFNSSIFSYPDNVIELLISRSKTQDIFPYIIDVTVQSNGGGFNWKKSPEGYNWWKELIINKKFSLIEHKEVCIEIKLGKKRFDEGCNVNGQKYWSFLREYIQNQFETATCTNNVANVSGYFRFNIEIIKDIHSLEKIGVGLYDLIEYGFISEEDKSKMKFTASLDIKDTIIDFPSFVIDSILEKSYLKNILAFIYNKKADLLNGGFNWRNTKDGEKFWKDVIINKKFSEVVSLFKKNTVLYIGIRLKNAKEKQRTQDFLERYISNCPQTGDFSIKKEIKRKVVLSERCNFIGFGIYKTESNNLQLYTIGYNDYFCEIYYDFEESVLSFTNTEMNSILNESSLLPDKYKILSEKINILDLILIKYEKIQVNKIEKAKIDCKKLISNSGKYLY